MGRRRLVVWSLVAVTLGGVVAGSGVSATFRAADHARLVPHRHTLRLLQFNVMQGATGGRAAAVAALIKHVRPDVATLDEVNVRKIFLRIASLTGMYEYWVRANDAYSVGILSRVPLHDCQPYRQPPIRHAAYSCRVRLGGRNWWIFGAHLYCCDETVRSQEAALLIEEMSLHRGRRVVLAGDLNAHTPGDPDPPASMLVIPELLGAGYVDSFRELHPVEQSPGVTVSAPPYGSWEARLDYVFHSALERTTSARVLSRVPGHQWPSDHAALLVTLRALGRHP